MQMCDEEIITHNISQEDCKPDLGKFICSDRATLGKRPWHRLDAIVSHHTVIQDTQARKIPKLMSRRTILFVLFVRHM